MIPERMRKFTVSEGGCWIWAGYLDRDGYGRQRHEGRMWLAHRLYVTLATGWTLTPDQEIDHLCRVRACVNPDHLEVVSRAENNTRMHAARTHCARGHALVEENVRRWRDRRICKQCDRENVAAYQLRRAGA